MSQPRQNDNESNNPKKRRQLPAHSTSHIRSRKEAAGVAPSASRPTVTTRSQTCEKLRNLVTDETSDGSYPRDWKAAIPDEHADDFVTSKFRRNKSLKTNIVHELVLASKESKWAKEEIKKTLVFVLRAAGEDEIGTKKASFLMEELLEEDFGDGTPILKALKGGRHRNRPFVEAVLALSPQPSNLGKIFSQPQKKTNTYCLHVAISSANMGTSGFDHIRKIVRHTQDYESPQKTQRRGRRQQDRSNKQLPASPFRARYEKDHNNTALHLAILKAPIDVTHLVNTDAGFQSELDPKSISTMKAAKELVEVLVGACPEALEERNGSKEGGIQRTPYQERIYRLAIEFANWNTNQQATTSVNADAPQGTSDHDIAARDFESPQIPVEIAQERDGYFSDGDEEDDRDHNRPPEAALAQKYYGDDKFREFVIRDPIASYISHYCIAKKQREEAMKYLYRPGEERATEFDLLGFPRQKITQDYLSSLETHVRFERTLKYVALPRLVVETTRTSTSTQALSSSTGQRSKAADMTEIFTWLYDRHVRKIQKVTVLDSDLHSHHDHKIVESLKRFEVEEWDWDKMDLSSQLKKISIYFHEGQEIESTLRERGKYIKDRLESRKWDHSSLKLSEAQSIATDAINLAKGLMATWAKEPGDENNDSSLKTLESRLQSLSRSTHGPERKDLEVDFDVLPMRAQTGSSRTRRTAISPENTRITKIKELTSFIRNSTWIDRPQTSRVKIAIIDDGLDPSLYIIDGKHSRVVAGQSFCTYSGYTKNYYVPSGNHGTQLASLICQICPEVDLCIARLAEQDTRGGNRVILLDSAERAIRWATDCGVDIMCMSWTIENRDTNDPKRLKGLQKAINAAYAQGIIMFCSASDQGGSSMVHCYPGASGDGKQCLRIGSCSASDVPSVWVDPGQVDFLMPGENLPIRNSDGNPEPQTGSSFATALGVGLAGLILYCSMRLRMGITPSAARSRGSEAEEEDSDVDLESTHHDDDDSDDGSVSSSSDQGRPVSNAAKGQTSQDKDCPNDDFPWNRDLMFKVFQQMSTPVGAESDKLLLPLPERFFISKIIELLKKRKGKNWKPLDKLYWDDDFSDTLRGVLQQLTSYQDDKRGYM